MDPVYLDANATTPVDPEVVDAMLPYLQEHFGNPSSTHVYGRRTRAAIERARAQVAELIGADPDEIVFTGGGTEASNLAIRWVDDGHVVTSAVEHPATSRCCDDLRRRGVDVEVLPVDGFGQVDPAAFTPRADTRLVTVMHSNNEVGTLQPIAALADEVGADVLVHTDAAQSLGKVPVNVDALGVDLLTIAGHKLYAPKGVGALYVRRGRSVRPVVLGAGHESGVRPGTENVAFIVGLGAACRLAHRHIEVVELALRALTDRLWTALCAGVPGIRLNGHPTERLPNTLNVSFPGVSGRTLLDATPDIAASTGSACHEDGSETASAVLLSMGLDPAVALGAVRLSLSRTTTEDDVDVGAAALIRSWKALFAIQR